MESKYKKCKDKYLKLKKNNFLILHSTKGFENLKNILRNGILKLSSDVYGENEVGYISKPLIYTQMYFTDLENVKPFSKYNLYFTPKILDEYSAVFHMGWRDKTLTEFNPNDTKKERNKKIKLVRDYLKNPVEAPQSLRDLNIMIHELVFSKQLDLHKYLKAVGCHQCEIEELAQLDQIIKEEFSETNVKLLKDYLPFKSKIK